MITIRKAIHSDVEQLKLLFDAYRVFYKQDSDVSGVENFISNRIQNNESIIFIALQADQMVGFTQLYPSFSSVSMKRLWILNDLYVDTSARSAGIGKALLHAAMEFAKQEKAKGLVLETGKENPAQKLYERLGWKQDEDYLHYYWTVPSAD